MSSPTPPSPTPTPARRRKHDRSEIPVSFLPEGNPPARRAYICALLGLIPGLGLVFGPIAIGFATAGLKVAAADEFHRGRGHSKISRLLGSLEIVSNAAGWAVLLWP
jgi:hypothetical protein